MPLLFEKVGEEEGSYQSVDCLFDTITFWVQCLLEKRHLFEEIQKVQKKHPLHIRYQGLKFSHDKLGR